MPIDETDEGVFDEMFETDESAFDEAARSWSGLRPKVATGRNTFTPRPTSQYVTQTQLNTALAKVGSQISTNSAAITKIGGQVAQIMGAIKKEAADRKKDFTVLRNNLNQTQQMAAILPLLTQTSSLEISKDVTIDTAKNQIDSGTQLPIKTNTLNLLLPMLLMTSSTTPGDSSGTSASGGLFGGSGDNNSLMMLALILAIGNK